MRILTIEDNESVCEMLEMFFSQEEWETTYVHDGQEGLDTFLEAPIPFDMIVLDLMLPSMDGIQVCKRIRETSSGVPIIMLTAKDTESDQVIGFEMGADDYVTKPFSPLTLVARMKALYRRSHLHESGEDTVENASFDIETDHLKINEKTREVWLYDEPLVGLTPKEYDLLYTMAERPKQVFSREQLLQTVWNYEYFGDERTVDAHIKKLRQKTSKNGPQVIQTVWGIGYKFDDTGELL